MKATGPTERDKLLTDNLINLIFQMPQPLACILENFNAMSIKVEIWLTLAPFLCEFPLSRPKSILREGY